jgi:3',5'-cyclic AMP phosphodiesterase CpdA
MSTRTDPVRRDLNRRDFLKCMAWAGTGIVWTVGTGGLLSGCTLPGVGNGASPKVERFSFVQISDNHVGFNADGVNTDVPGTMRQVVDRINALPKRPAFVLHTGDVSHFSKPAEFDTAQQILGEIKTDRIFYVPGEHDVIGDSGAAFRQRFAPKGGKTDWYSQDLKGVHFVALWNVGDEATFGVLGTDQLGWLAKDLRAVGRDTPVVVFAHVPLYALYPQWGWSTNDGAAAMELLKPFASVTVLNGHIHQVATKVEGNIRFYTAYSTAFPQHMPGEGQPGAYKLPADELRRRLGFRSVEVVDSKQPLAVIDTVLG